MIDIKEKLSHVYWIGGSPCAGKTTLVRQLIKEYNFTYYKCDICYDDHMSRSKPDLHPTMYRIKHLSWNEVWSTQFCSIPVEQQIQEVVSVYREQFLLILEDLFSMTTTSNILIEGAALLPEKVAPLLYKPNQAIWFVPTPAFQVEHYSKREWTNEILKHYDTPEKAFSNWMSRDMGFAREITNQTDQLSLETIIVDGSKSIEQNYDSLLQKFMLK